MKLPWDKDKINEISNGVKPSTSILDEVFNGKYINPISQLEYEIKSYPDNTKYVIVKKITNNLTFRLNTYEDLWILNQIHDVVKKANWKVTITIPNLIDAQDARRFDDAQPFGLKLVLEFLKGMKNFDYKIFHPHNSEVVEAILDDRVEIINNFEFIQKVLSNIYTEIKSDDNLNTNIELEDNLILMSSDAGGFKPLMKLCDKLEWQGETYSASKSRKYENGKSILTQIVDRQDFNGKDILIIDDICVYGGTFKGLSKILKERNCGKLYLAVSHITIQDLGTDSVSEYFDKIFTTNSKFDSYFKTPVHYNNIKNLSIINLF